MPVLLLNVPLVQGVKVRPLGHQPPAGQALQTPETHCERFEFKSRVVPSGQVRQVGEQPLG